MHQNKSLPGEEACLLWGGFSVLKNESCFVLFLVVLCWKWFRQLHPHTATGVQVGFSFSDDIICVTKSKRISPNEATVNIYKGSWIIIAWNCQKTLFRFIQTIWILQCIRSLFPSHGSGVTHMPLHYHAEATPTLSHAHHAHTQRHTL